GEPDFLAVRRPGQTLRAIPLTGQFSLFAGKVDDGNGAAVVPLVGMVHEGHEVALGGNSRTTNPASAGRVENFADGILQLVAASHIPNHGQTISVGGPIRPF